MLITSTKSSIDYVKAILYGDAGVGKTVLLSTAPAPIILSVEQGLLSLSDKEIDVIEIPYKNSLKVMNEAYKFLKDDKEHNTIGLDSLSELAESMLIEYKDNEKDPRKAYGRMADELYDITRKFRSLNKHIVFITKQVYETDENGKTSYRPFTPGKSFTLQVPYLFDEVFCMRLGRSGTETVRYIQTQPDFQYSAKDRSGKLLKSEEPDLTKIFNKILARGE